MIKICFAYDNFVSLLTFFLPKANHFDLLKVGPTRLFRLDLIISLK